MSVIIRLQNLPWSANALDIRQYFRGLSIPEGGVHIVGGELGDAFIAFSTDEDARQAFQLNNGKIKEIQIKLLLSSRTEMQKVIEAARTTQTPFMQAVVPPVTPTPAAIPQAPVISQSVTQEVAKKTDNKDSKSRDRDDSKSRDRDDSKNRRDRSRRRTRSRSRSRDRKDRSRDRRDRRRRDRSRSRDRRDRRRDNRRGRSRSRDRTRSRDRDSRRVKDDKKDSRLDKSNDGGVIEIKDDGNCHTRVWEQSAEMPVDVKIQQGLLGNYPASTSSLEDARRSLGLLTGLQNNGPTGPVGPVGPIHNMNNRFQRNDMNNPRDNRWDGKGRFPDRNAGMHHENNDNMPMLAQFQGNLPMRPNMNQNMNMSPGIRPNMFPNQQGMRMPFPQDNGYGINRPFLSRPGTVFPDQFRQQERNTQMFAMNVERNEDSFRNDNRNQSSKLDCCVQLRPYFGGYGEVRKFFHGLFISNTGVKFVADNTGKRTGIVYIKFVRPDGKEQALSRTGMMLRGVPVEVAHLDDEEWERYGDVDQSKIEEGAVEIRHEPEVLHSPHQSQHFSCVVVDDLPEFAKEHDILKMFSEYTIISVHMVENKQYRQLAYVQFSKEDDVKNATADKTLHVISGKPVTVRPISDETFNEVQRQQTSGDIADVRYENTMSSSPHEHPDQFQANVPPNIVTDCVLLNGLPPKTNDRDVLDFFSDIALVPLKIHIMLGKFGPTGDCYCEFNNSNEAVRALDKNGMPLGAGTIRVEPVHRRDMDRALGVPSVVPTMNQGPVPRFPNRFGPRGPNMLGPRGPPNMMRRRPPGPGPGMRYDGPAEPMGPPGCVVTMENVPFKAGVNEILDFFENFDLPAHNVFRRFNEVGAPTGDARVTFTSPVEARRAVEECNKLKIRDRTIYLRVL